MITLDEYKNQLIRTVKMPRLFNNERLSFVSLEEEIVTAVLDNSDEEYHYHLPLWLSYPLWDYRTIYRSIKEYGITVGMDFLINIFNSETQLFNGVMAVYEGNGYFRGVKTGAIYPLSEISFFHGIQVYKDFEVDRNRKEIKRALLTGQIRAICGFPGIGKSYLAGSGQDDRFVDSHFTKCLYKYSSKKELDPNFPDNFQRYVQYYLDRGRIIVTSLRQEARDVLEDMGVPYLMLYPHYTEKERYIDLYRQRGSEEAWIIQKVADWNDKISYLNKVEVKTPNFKDELPIGQNLTGYLEGLDCLGKGRPCPIMFSGDTSASCCCIRTGTCAKSLEGVSCFVEETIPDKVNDNTQMD